MGVIGESFTKPWLVQFLHAIEDVLHLTWHAPATHHHHGPSVTSAVSVRERNLRRVLVHRIEGHLQVYAQQQRPERPLQRLREQCQRCDLCCVSCAVCCVLQCSQVITVQGTRCRTSGHDCILHTDKSTCSVLPSSSGPMQAHCQAAGRCKHNTLPRLMPLRTGLPFQRV